MLLIPCCSAREGRRFHMGWLQLKRWLSFLPAAFVVYILLHYLVYQPADLAARHNQPVLVHRIFPKTIWRPKNGKHPFTVCGYSASPACLYNKISVPRSADSPPGSTDGNEGGASRGGGRTLQSGPRVLPLMHQPSVPEGDAAGDTQSPQQAAPSATGGGTNGSGIIVTSDSPAPQEVVAAVATASKEDNNNTESGPDISVGNSSNNKIVLISEEPQPKSPTAQAQASSSSKPSGKGVSPGLTAKASAAASVAGASPTAAKEQTGKPQAGMGAAAGLSDSNKSGSVAVVRSSSPAHQTVTKKTTVVKKSNVASSGGLAINALKGKTTVGQKYESGFSFPHEELCMNNGRDLKVLVLITTAPDHEKHRTAIRQTWGHWNLRKDVVMAFMVGRTSNANTQTGIDAENEQYSDIIQANFVDHYSNLTLKTVAMFEWTKTYCSESHFVLKTDDDMFINMPYLLSFIDSKKNDKKVMYGRLAKGWKPVRNRKSKYFIDTATYSKTKYPDFLTGPAYLFTSDIVDDLYNKALSTTFFVLEDVLLTGIVGESLRIKRVGDSRFRNEKIKLTDTCQLLKTISIHMVKYEEQFDIYKRTLDGKAKCKKG